MAKLFDRFHSSVGQNLAPSHQIQPPIRRRSRLALTPAEREELFRGLIGGESIRSIAEVLGRAPSTMSREITRIGGLSAYRASRADVTAEVRGHRPKTCALAENHRKAPLVAGTLQLKCSPEQIAGPTVVYGFLRVVAGSRYFGCITA